MKEEVLEIYPLEKPFPNSRFMYVNNARLHVREWDARADESGGVKGNILLVHGISGSSYNWRFLAPALAQDGWQVFSVDIPPFGFSGEPQKEGPSLDPLNKDSASRALLLWQAVDLLSPDIKRPFVILGHSLGGRIACHMVLMRPDTVSGLILIAPAVYGNSVIPGITKYWPFKAIVQNSGPLVLENRNVMEFVMSRAYGRDVTHDEFLGNWAPFVRPGMSEACSEWAVESIDSQEPEITNIKTHTLILWSRKDKIVKNKGKWLLSRLDNSRYVEIKGKSHCPMDTHSDIVNREVLSFLALLPEAGE